ncbi:putative lipid II flippase FtsW [Streptomyces sp. DSM 44915]|uniref:Probable peptidoglycan glycosyltransferase FtsW n=1 Tax=Streptomyces chisholmiae TaxID=3075540 RepID=A0ABU2JJ13_9ACTN|nr:putative lipid II flippase FtsW [Streptomyces sp. DSM 44915]MDT0264978.1 putative lipid II flippase FtsW [Streptomyces sp. DSM 44915]
MRRPPAGRTRLLGTPGAPALAGAPGGLAARGTQRARAPRPAARRPSPGRAPAKRPARGPRRPRSPRFVERLRAAWDRPLTAYYVLMGTALLITLLGLVMVFSASQIQALRFQHPATFYFRKQLLAAVLGGVLLLIASRIPIRLLRALTYPFLAFAVVLLVLVQVPGIGVEVNGSTNWIAVGGSFQLQPSEFAKLGLLLWGADLLARKEERALLTQWRHLLVPLLPGALLVFGLVMVGGDMGTVMILVAVLFSLLWLAGAPTKLFVGVLAAAAVLFVLFVTTAPHRMDRLACLGATDPGPNDRCWQAVHGIYALASGGWFGSGLGASVEKWGELPEPHTDFIFAITGEELGLAGTLSVLGLFAALGYAGIRVAGRTEDPFVRYAAGGVTAWLMTQTVINIGAVLGLLPIAGVPLPLFSYGGSALLPTMFAVGLLIAFARGEPAARAALAMRSEGLRRKTMRRRARSTPSGER